jgi:hypothetical protein
MRFDGKLEDFAYEAKVAYKRTARAIRTDREENHDQAVLLNSAYQFIVKQLAKRGVCMTILTGLWVVVAQAASTDTSPSPSTSPYTSTVNLLAGGFLAVLTAWLFFLQRRMVQYDKDERASHGTISELKANIVDLKTSVLTLEMLYADLKSDIRRSDERNYDAHMKILDQIQKLIVAL